MTKPTFRAAAAADPGGRPEQQDRTGLFMAGDRMLAAVADGLGGHHHGAAAATAVIEVAAAGWETLKATADPDVPAMLRGLTERAHTAINAIDGDSHSTCVLLAIAGKRAFWRYVGDSRLYRLRTGRAEALTRDHSLAFAMAEKGEITMDEIATHPAQGQLLQALGGPEAPAGDEGQAALEPDDAFVLCSDGFWEVVRPTELPALVAGDDLEENVRAWIQEAARRGGPGGDNLAIVAVAQWPNQRRRWLGRLTGALRHGARR